MRLACMFPGQGSQSVGMLKDVYETDTIIATTFEEASSVLGFDLWDMVQNGPESVINDTLNTQVVMLVADIAMFRYLKKHGMPMPEMMAGHSLGEYAALVCADSLSVVDAAKLVRKRAELMQKAVEGVSGAMAAIIGLDPEIITNICLDIAKASQNKVLSPANFNATGQIVIAGHRDLVEKAILVCEESGARMAKLIPVSVPCHCDLMKPAVEKFATVLSEIQFDVPKIKVISNVDLSIYSSVSQIQELLTKQLFMPVRWTETLAVFEKAGIDSLIECGPGKVLSGLAKRTVPQLKNMFCFEPQHLPEWEVV
jgi:[acyl-carrier-protein] S-malonyltransferase